MQDQAFEQLSEEDKENFVATLRRIHERFCQSVAEIMQAEQVHPVIMATLLATESCTLTWCSMMEEGNVDNDAIRAYWSSLIERIRTTELSEATLNRNREVVLAKLASQGQEAETGDAQ